MHCLDELINVCKIECKEQNIPISSSVVFKTSYRAKRTYGSCKPNLVSNSYEITISSFLLDDSVPVNSVKMTILHELIHTCPGCQNHGKTFRKYAALLNKQYNYDIKRTSSREERGITTPYNSNEEIKYVIKCKCCGNTYYRRRKSRLITKSYLYRCGKCGGKLSIDNIL